MSKGLKNPVAGLIIAGEGAKKASAAASSIDSKTNNALSWLAVAGVVVVGYYVFKLLKTAGGAVDAAGNIVGGIGDAFEPTTGSGGGNVGDINPTEKPTGATINMLQAEAIAASLLVIFSTFGTANQAEKQQIYSLLFNKNAKDFQMISNAFGTPRRTIVFGGEALPGFGERLNLMQWLNLEIGAAGINFLKTITHGIF